VYRALRLWLELRRAIRRRWQADARALVQIDETEAYYAAQRLAARARADGLTGDFLHWTKVAAEVARVSSRANMNLASVQAIVDKEL
jgi:regulator of protease activity HflC (stomatin/prohibitin superfamily)